MPCYHPKPAWYHVDGGRPVFHHHPAPGSSDWIRGQIDCRVCFGCQAKYAAEWGVRCYHESRMHERNCFLTLTYDERHRPGNHQLSRRDLRLFLVQMRHHFSRKHGVQFRVFACGEYGGASHREHYHLCIFGVDFDDKVFTRKSNSGYKVYESKTLDAIWGKGIATVGELTIETANYCARYCLKKRAEGDEPVVEDWRFVHRKDASWHVDPATGRRYRFQAEFAIKSRGLGFSFLEKYHQDVFHFDGDFCMLPGGVKVRTPDAYLRILRGWCEDDYLELKARRVAEAAKQLADSLPSRLEVRESVARARLAHFSQSLARSGV